MAGDRFFGSLVIHSFNSGSVTDESHGMDDKGAGLALVLLCLRELCVLENRPAEGAKDSSIDYFFLRRLNTLLTI